MPIDVETLVDCAVLRDGGKNYEKPVKICDVSKLALGMRRGPRIAAGHGNVVVSAVGHEAGNQLSWRSTDGGKTWREPVQVNDSPNDAREGLSSHPHSGVANQSSPCGNLQLVRIQQSLSRSLSLISECRPVFENRGANAALNRGARDLRATLRFLARDRVCKAFTNRPPSEPTRP